FEWLRNPTTLASLPQEPQAALLSPLLSGRDLLLLLSLAAVLERRNPAGLDFNPPWLHLLRNLSLQLDREQAVIEIGSDDIHIVGQLKAAFEGSLRDAAMQILAGL